MTIKKLQNRLAKLYTLLESELGSSQMDLVRELVELELELEALSNQ